MPVTKWEVCRDGQVIAWGPAATMPDPQERKRFRSDGYKIYVDGKIFKN